MKQKDILLIIVVIVGSGIASLILSSLVINPAKGRQTKIIEVSKIKSDFNQPDPKYFNSNAIDPTQLIKIGNSLNTKPFNDLPVR
ncbi:MAG: hypothetical protein NVSMB46_00910 [Candidatus Saccharimonadales bacterium]